MLAKVRLSLFLLLLGTVAARRLGRLIRTWSRRSGSPHMLLEHPIAADRTFDGHPVPAEAFLMHPHNDLGHRYWAAALVAGDTVVDATLGNGHDATFLASALGRVGGGTLICLDVQHLAIERSQARMREHLESEGWKLVVAGGEGNACESSGGSSSYPAWDAYLASSGSKLTVRWQRGCHAQLLDAMSGRCARLVVFNLGYLPGGDKAIVTTTATTIPALEAAQRVVTVGGAVSVTLYPGHTEGMEEEAVVLEHAAALPQGQWSVYHAQWLNQRNKRTGRRAPSLVLMQYLHE